MLRLSTLTGRGALYINLDISKKPRSISISTIGQLVEAADEFLQWYLGKIGLASESLKRHGISLVLKIDHISTIKSVDNSTTTLLDLVNADGIHLVQKVEDRQNASREFHA